MLGEGVDDRRRQRRHQRRAHLPRRDASPTEASGSDGRARRAPPAAAVDPTASSPRSLDLGRRTCATRCGASTRPASRRVDAPGGLIVAGMGGSAVGGRLAARRARPAPAPPARARDRLRHAAPGSARETLVLCSSYSGTTEETLACYDAAKARRRAAARRPPPAARWPSAPAPTACRSSRCPAASSRAPRSATRSSSRSRSPRCAAPRRRCATRSRPRPRSPPSWPREWGPDGAEDGEAKRLARALHGTRPGDHGRRADRAGRLPLEVPGQRERQAARVRERAAGARPQRDRRLGGRRAARFAPCSSRTPRRDARMRARFERDGRADRRRAPRSSSASRARGDSRLERLVSLVLLGDLVSLYLAVLRGVDPVACRDRHAQAAAGGGRARLAAAGAAAG